MFDLLDLDTRIEWGPFQSHGEARLCAHGAGITSFLISCEGEPVERVEVPGHLLCQQDA